MTRESVVPLLDSASGIDCRNYAINCFISSNEEIPIQHGFKVRIKQDEFYEKLSKIVNYKFLYHRNYYDKSKNRFETMKNGLIYFTESKDSIYLFVEHPDSPTSKITGGKIYYSPEGLKQLEKRSSSNIFIDNIIILMTINPDKRTQEVFEKVKDLILSFKYIKEKTKNSISIVVSDDGDLSLTSFEIKRPKLDLKSNYNDDFEHIHKTIINRINKKDADGLVLLHGDPGGGKTNYIKFLLSLVKKKVVYLPPNLANEVSSPSFINFLTQHPNSVLVIEDAENIIKSRKVGGSQAISNLLNISNGLLSDILRIQIIATFNCPISEIDTALLRKGRLIAKYDFRKLDIDKAQLLSDKLGFKHLITSEMSLAEIYNQNEEGFIQERERIGFKK
jgi:hypothetical protein